MVGRGRPGRTKASPFPWIPYHDVIINPYICMYKIYNDMVLNKINSMGGYFSSSIKTIDYVKKKNVESNTVSTIQQRE